MVTDNVLYVATYEGKILAYDPVGEEKLWTYPVARVSGGGGFCGGGQVSHAMGVYGTPAVRDDRVYVGTYQGTVLWVSRDGTASSTSEFKTDGPIVGSVKIHGDTLYVGSGDGNLYALDLNVPSLGDSLKEGWPFKTGGKIWSTPVVVDDVVYLASADHNLYAVDTESGKEIWRFEADGAIMSTPCVANGMVYVGGCDRKFYSVRAATGDERAAVAAGEPATVREAEAVFDQAGNWFWTQALVVHDEVWVGCLDHYVYILDAQSLDLVEKIKTEGMVYAPPLAVQGMVVVGSQDGRLYVIDAATKEYTAYAVHPDTDEVYIAPDKPDKNPAPILAPMFADEASGVVYYHAQDGAHRIYGFSLSTREILWTYQTDKISD